MKIAINKLHPFYNHPFKVIDNAEMDDLVLSIKEQGILTPIIVRPLENTSDEFEIISGHLLSFFWFPSSCEVLRLYFTADIFVNLRLVLNNREGDFLFLAELPQERCAIVTAPFQLPDSVVVIAVAQLVIYLLTQLGNFFNLLVGIGNKGFYIVKRVQLFI